VPDWALCSFTSAADRRQRAATLHPRAEPQLVLHGLVAAPARQRTLSNRPGSSEQPLWGANAAASIETAAGTLAAYPQLTRSVLKHFLSSSEMVGVLTCTSACTHSWARRCGMRSGLSAGVASWHCTVAAAVRPMYLCRTPTGCAGTARRELAGWLLLVTCSSTPTSILIACCHGSDQSSRPVAHSVQTASFLA
jgi:hypothetical protein